MDAPVLAAEYTNSTKRRPATLTINRIADGRRSLVTQMTVAGKAEARRIAAQHSAKPWNF